MKMRFCYLLILISLNTYAAQKGDVAFVFFDAGETLALEPVVRNLEERNVKVKALVMGTAREVFPNGKSKRDIKKECGVGAAIDRADWDRRNRADFQRTGFEGFFLLRRAFATCD